MKQVRKTVIKVTVLSEESRGGFGPTDCTLEEIAREMDAGCFLGGWDIESSTILPADNIEDECAAVNNDGTFFAEDED
jgi:hypothetical protein